MTHLSEEDGLLKRITDLSDRLSSLEAKTTSVLNSTITKTSLFVCRPLGLIRTAFATKNGVPRQGTVCPQLRAELRISRDIFSNPSHSLEGLNEFKYIWLMFWFHLNEDHILKAKVRPPRMNGMSTGVFSTRSPHRPNPIGLTLACLERIDGDTLILTGVDLVDGTPIFDIKPYIPSYDRPPDNGSEDNETWVHRVDQNQLLNNVVFTAEAYESLRSFHKRCKPEFCSRCLEFIDEEALIPAMNKLLKSDLRSVYRKTKCSDRIHFVIIDRVKLSVWYRPDGSVQVLQVAAVNKGCDKEEH